MKTTSYFLSLLTIGTLIMSCKKDNTPENPDKKDGKITSLTDPDFNKEALQGDITNSISLKKDTYTLTGVLRVKENATLTIAPGTVIKAKAAQDTDRTKLFIAVEMGAKIMAVGTATNPILMTSADSKPAAGNWGGLLICGKARQNKSEGSAVAEVGDLKYGGNKDDDNSGRIEYVILKYTGSAINPESEFNGFTFYAVGNKTVVKNIACFNGSDDGIEFFGGSVNVENALVVNVKDDIFDWTDGWTGTATNFYGVREDGFILESEDPRGLEGDNNESDNAAKPVSNPVFNKLTIVNLSKTTAFKDVLKIRRGSKVTITNALLVAIDGAVEGGDVVDLKDKKGNASVEGVSIMANVSGFDTDAVKKENDSKAEVTLTKGKTGGANTSVFEWTKFEFPSL